MYYHADIIYLEMPFWKKKKKDVAKSGWSGYRMVRSSKERWPLLRKTESGVSGKGIFLIISQLFLRSYQVSRSNSGQSNHRDIQLLSGVVSLCFKATWNQKTGMDPFLIFKCCSSLIKTSNPNPREGPKYAPKWKVLYKKYIMQWKFLLTEIFVAREACKEMHIHTHCCRD